jgi:hypothetical protein
VSGLAARLRDVAALAERAAVARQHAELAGTCGDPAVIGGLQYAAENLYHAASLVESPPPASARVMIQSVVTLVVWAVSCVAGLLSLPDPVRPWMVAATLAGSAVLAAILVNTAAVVWDRRAARALTSTEEPGGVQEAIAELRTRLSTITATLETDRYDTHLEVGQQIERTLLLLDAVEQEAVG